MDFELFTTERLLLKKWTPREFNYLFENFTEKQIRKELGFTKDSEYLRELEKYKEGYSSFKRSLVHFQLIDKMTGKIIGACGYHNWMIEHHRAELGYALSKDDYKNIGIMTEALSMVIDHGFKQLGLNRIEACVGPDNIPSIKLLKKFSFTQEGHLRQHYIKDNVIHDSLIFSLLKEEYKPKKDKPAK